jgi:hypothetical protein
LIADIDGDINKLVSHGLDLVDYLGAIHFTTDDIDYGIPLILFYTI